MACGWLVVDELHITVIAVDPDHRQRGLGTHLLQALLQRARQEGAAHATLEVSSDNHPARALYRRAGFHTAGCRQSYYRNGQDACNPVVAAPTGESVLKLFGFPPLGTIKVLNMFVLIVNFWAVDSCLGLESDGINRSLATGSHS